MAEKGIAGPRVTKLGRYEVLNELGKGAMGVVYLAKDPVIGRMVAIKTIRTSSFGDDDSESREFRERFIREAQTAGILSHPNIVTIHDIGEDPETLTSFIAMEYIEGRNLKSLLAEKNRFGWEQIADIIAQVAEAIDYAHRKGIIHRDIKPANIIITTDAKVKIMDFGIAKIASSNLTTTGQFLGTPNYMSPEQVSGAAVDGRSDIFSLGVVLYELLTNRKPFQGENLTAISYKIVHEEFTPPADLAPEVPPDFNVIVARAMAKDPWNRYQRGKDLALALHQLKARLEEQKALRDLGSMVSAAENMPTLRLENVEKSAPGISAGAATTVLPRDADRADWTEDSGASAAPRIPRPSAASPARASDSGNRRTGSGSLDRRPEAQTQAIPVPPPSMEPPSADDAVSAPPAPPPGPAQSLPPTQPLAAAAKAARLPPIWVRAREIGARLIGEDWKHWLKSEVNTPYFWGAAGAIALFAFLVCGALLLRASMAARPTAPMDPAVEKEALDRKQALENAKTLFSAGKYEQSLGLLRQVLSHSPGNEQARQYAQMAENALAGRAEQQRRSAEADSSLDAARAALAGSRYEDAVRYADEALALDGGKVEAQELKNQATAKLAEAKSAQAEAARKRRDEKVASVRHQPTAAPAARAEHAAPTPAAAPAAAAGPGTLRLLFDSPISEGSIMIYVNDEKVLQKPFDFSKKVGFFKRVEGTGTVEEPITVKPGSVNVKVWLYGKGLTATAFTTVTGQISGGETRTLRLEYSGKKLSAHIQ